MGKGDSAMTHEQDRRSPSQKIIDAIPEKYRRPYNEMYTQLFVVNTMRQIKEMKTELEELKNDPRRN